MKRFLVTSCASLLLLASNVSADFQAGLVAIAERQYEEAFKQFKPLAEKGNAAAQINLGNLYMKGLGVDQNYSLAFSWYQKAADQGEHIAQTKLGLLYYFGLGVGKDPIEASRWFEKAALQGDVRAQATLGSIYAAGEGTQQDYAKAYYWYMLAEEQGDKEAARGRQTLEEDMTPGQKDEALRLLAVYRKNRIEQEEKAFEDTTKSLPIPAQAKPEPAATKQPEPKSAQPASAKKPKK